MPRRKTRDPIPRLTEEVRATVPTDVAAYHLDRQPQTLRKWASIGGVGQLIPLRINGRLHWPVEAIKTVLGVKP